MRLFIFLFVLCLVLSCSDELTLKNDYSLSEEEWEVMEACQNDALLNKDSILNNLIGDWSLVGYACYCIPHQVPSIKLKISQDSIMYFYLQEELIEINSLYYELKETAKGFMLETQPKFYPLQVDVFCLDYMYYDDNPSDGHMYLYRKN